MPQRTFDQLDLISPTNGWEPNSPSTTVENVAWDTPTFVNPSNFSISVSGVANDVTLQFQPVPETGEATKYFSRGIIDFQRFPSIPENSLITEIVVTKTINNNLDNSIVCQQGQALAYCFGMVPLTEAQQALEPFFEHNVGPSPQSASVSTSSVGGTIVETYDAAYFLANFGSEKISYDEFDANFKNFELLAEINNGYAGPNSGSPTMSGHVDVTVGYSDWSMVVTYEESWQFEVTPPPDPVEPGDQIEVESDSGDPNALDMTQIQTVEIHYIDENGDPQTIPVPEDLWIIITIILFIFEMPDFPEDMLWFEIVITSTQFSGSISLGTFITLYFTSATGIYKLDTESFHDTLYLENDPPNTVDVKIPNPRFKTGYIGG